MDVAELVARFRADGDENVIRALNQVDRGVSNVADNSVRAGRGLGTVFQVAGGFLAANAIGGIFNAAKGLIDVQTNAEQAKVSLEVVTGSVEEANRVFGEVQEFAKSTPFQFPELLDATIQMEGFGLKSEDWLTTIGDTASAMGKSIDQVTQAVLDVQTGEYERLKELGIKAKVEGDKLTFSYDKNGQRIEETVDRTNQAVVNSTLQGIWNDKYAGAMEMQSKTFGGQMSTLKDNIALTMQEATAGVFSFATRGLAFVNDIFADGFVATIRDRFGPGAAEFVGHIGTMASGIIEAFGEGRPVSEIVKSLPESWQPVGDAVFRAADAFGELITNLKQGDWSEVAEDVQQLAEAGLDLGKIVLDGAFELAGDLASGAWAYVERYAMGSAVTGDGTGGPDTDRTFSIGEVLINGVVKLIGDLNNIGGAIAREIGLQSSGPEIEAARQAGREAGQTFADEIIAAFNAGANTRAQTTGEPGLFSVVLANILDVGQFVHPSINSSQNTFVDEVFQWSTGFGESLGVKVREGIEFGIMLASEGGAGIAQAIVNFLDFPAMKSELQTAADFAGTLVDSGMALVMGLFDGAARGWEAFHGWLTSRDEAAQLAVGELGETLYTKGSQLLEGMWLGAGDVWDYLTGWLAGLGASAAEWVGDLSGYLFQSGKSLIEGMINGISAMLGPLESIVNTVNSVIDRIDRSGSPWPMMVKSGGELMQGMVLGIRSGMSSLANTVGDVNAITGMVGGSPRLAMAGSGGGAVVNISLAGAFIGRGAESEIRGLIERYGGAVSDRRVNAAALAGARR